MYGIPQPPGLLDDALYICVVHFSYKTGIASLPPATVRALSARVVPKSSYTAVSQSPSKYSKERAVFYVGCVDSTHNLLRVEMCYFIVVYRRLNTERSRSTCFDPSASSVFVVALAGHGDVPVP